MRAPLAVLCAARDEEEQLPGALASVGWADELVVVVDPRSRDGTRQVAADAGAACHEHPFSGLGAQWNWGIGRCRCDWVLLLDADERVTAPLAAAIEAALAAPRYPAYELRRRNLVLGRPVRFGDWGRDRVVRLLDRRRVRVSDHPVHPVPIGGPVGRLAGELEHHTLRSLPQYLAKLDDYACRGGAELAGRRAPLAQALPRAAWRFLRAYLVRGGALDGSRGLLLAGLSAWGTFLKWAAAWEAGRRDG